MDFKSLKGHGVGLNLQAIINAIQKIQISKIGGVFFLFTWLWNVSWQELISCRHDPDLWGDVWNKSRNVRNEKNYIFFFLN